MASLADSLAQLGPSRNVERCPIKHILAALENHDAFALEEALADRSINAVDLARVIQSAGHLISADAVRRHRRRACMCESYAPAAA